MFSTSLSLFPLSFFIFLFFPLFLSFLSGGKALEGEQLPPFAYAGGENPFVQEIFTDLVLQGSYDKFVTLLPAYLHQKHHLTIEVRREQ